MAIHGNRKQVGADLLNDVLRQVLWFVCVLSCFVFCCAPTAIWCQFDGATVCYIRPFYLGWLLEFYVLGTCKVISGWIPSCDSAQPWWPYSPAPLWDQASSTMTQCSTQSHYPDPEPTSPCPILIISSTWLGSDRYQFLSHQFDSARNQTPNLPHARSAVISSSDWCQRVGGGNT